MAYSWPAGGEGVDREMSPTTGEEDEDVPQGGMAEGKDGKVGRDETVEKQRGLGKGKRKMGGVKEVVITVQRAFYLKPPC